MSDFKSTVIYEDGVPEPGMWFARLGTLSYIVEGETEALALARAALAFTQRGRRIDPATIPLGSRDPTPSACPSGLDRQVRQPSAQGGIVSEDTLVAALARAQAAFPEIHKTKTATVPTKAGGSYSYKYADLHAIMKAIVPVLAEHGIAVMQPIMGDELHTVIAGHGEEFRSAMPLNLEGLQPQAVGSLLTYYKRYAITSMLAIAVDEDDDGTAAQNADREPGGSGVWQSGSRFAGARPATSKQIGLASKLLKEIVHENLTAQFIEDATGRAAAVEDLTAPEMSKLIDALYEARKQGRTPDGAVDSGTEPFA